MPGRALINLFLPVWNFAFARLSFQFIFPKEAVVGIIPFCNNYEYVSCLSLPPSFLVFSSGIATHTSERSILVSPLSSCALLWWKYHKLGGLNNRNVFLTALEPQKPKTRVPTCFSSGEGHPPDHRWLSSCSHTAESGEGEKGQPGEHQHSHCLFL